MNRIKVSSEALKAIRIEMAYLICSKYHSVYRKLYGNRGYVMPSLAPVMVCENEEIASSVLKELCKLESSMKPILEIYFK